MSGASSLYRTFVGFWRIWNSTLPWRQNDQMNEVVKLRRFRSSGWWSHDVCVSVWSAQLLLPDAADPVSALSWSGAVAKGSFFSKTGITSWGYGRREVQCFYRGITVSGSASFNSFIPSGCFKSHCCSPDLPREGVTCGREETHHITFFAKSSNFHVHYSLPQAASFAAVRVCACLCFREYFPERRLWHAAREVTVVLFAVLYFLKFLSDHPAFNVSVRARVCVLNSVPFIQSYSYTQRV